MKLSPNTAVKQHVLPARGSVRRLLDNAPRFSTGSRKPSCTVRFTSINVCCVLVFLFAQSAGLCEEHPVVDPKLGWKSLFNGKDLLGWTSQEENWAAEGGVIAGKGYGYLTSTERYGNFVLDLEFKIAPRGNGGIVVRHRFVPKSRRDGGIEVQILDSHGKDIPGKHDCGAIYDMIEPSKDMARPAGQWNHMTITCNKSQVGVILNGEKVVDIDLDDWSKSGKNPDGTPNKYQRPVKDFVRKGFVLLQNHGAPIWFRNLYIKRLD